MKSLGLAVALLLLVGPVAAQSEAEEPEVPMPVPEMIEVPAGVSLISAPVDAGAGSAREAFGGIEPEWPLFFGWDASRQHFTGPEETMLSMGAGFWYYAPAPTTLVVIGEPYRSITHHTSDIYPGWHLVGVPYSEGVDWQGLRLYRSGNPVSLETAETLGWVRMPVLGQWGSEWQALEAGRPFEPGHAYWLRATVPLSVRLEPSSTSRASAGPRAGGAAGGDAAGQAEVSTAWIGGVGEALQDIAETGVMIAEGQYALAAFKGLGAILGLAHYGLESSDDHLMDKLNTMDGKLDTLLDDMQAISTQVTNLENEIEIVKDTIEVNRLSDKLATAQLWLDSYQTNPRRVGRTVAWASWEMAGCDPTGHACTNQITQESYDKFRALWCRDPFKLNDPPVKLVDPTNDFFVYWSYSVLGHLGVEKYTANGMDADQIVSALHNTMLEDPTTNPLLAFQDKLFLSGDCRNDVTDPGCDLYTDVYLPFEAYFQKVVASQTALVEALIEAAAVRAQVDPGHYSNDPKARILDFEIQLAAETEMFLKVAEQIALYRAADGRFAWKTFDTTDAAHLLARADFVAMRLIGHAYNPPTLNPPWPEQGVTGRIFYSIDEPLSVATRQVCPTGGACSDFPEASGTLREVTGTWPYLVWTPSGDTAIGAPKVKWKVRRLQPMDLPVGEYTVTSAVPAREQAGLVVARYDDAYTSRSKAPEEATERVLPFGSFVGLEGHLGEWALAPPRGKWSTSGGQSNDTHTFAVTTALEGTTVNVTFKDTSHFVKQSGDWSESTKVRLPNDPVYAKYPRARVFWPASFLTSLSASRSPGSYMEGDCPKYYFRKLQQELGLVDSNGNTVGSADHVSKACGDQPFNSCDNWWQIWWWDLQGAGALASSALSLRPDETYTFKATYSDEVQSGVGLAGEPFYCYWHWTPTSDSYAMWVEVRPTITLVK